MADKRADLQKLRVACGYTQQTLAAAIEASTGSVRSWESGARTPTARLRRALAAVLGVSVHTINRLVGLEPPVDLEGQGHDVPHWLSHYDSLVLEAGWLTRLEKDVIPDILQTKAYANAVERAAPVSLTEEQILERVDIRMSRQRVLHRADDPLRLDLLIAESVLRATVGGIGVMRAQIDHLIVEAGRPNVEIRVLRDGSAVCSPGGFELFMRRFEPRPFLAVTFDMAGPHYYELPEVIRRFANTFDHLSGVALPPTESLDIMKAIRETHQ